MDELRTEWRSRLTPDERMQLDTIHKGIGRDRAAEHPLAAEEAARLAKEHCFERSSVVPERTLLREALRRSYGQASRTTVERAALGGGLIRAEHQGGQWVTTQAMLAEESAVVKFAREGTPAGRMHRRISTVFASYQTDQQASDIRGGHKRRVENGLPLGRLYGYRLVRVNGRSVVELDPIQAPKVKRIFELFAYSPLTLETLIETLARQGVTYTDSEPKWTRSTLHRLLHNRSYIGEVWYQGVWHPGTFEALVDHETCQAVHDKFGTDFKVNRNCQITYAGGLMKCGHCGHVITGETKTKKSPDGTLRQYTYYRCMQYRTEGHPIIHCAGREIDQQLLTLFGQIRVEDAESRQWFVDVIRARARGGQAENTQHREELKRQHEQVEAKLSTLLEMRVEGEITPEEYAAKRCESHDRQSTLRVQLEVSDRDDHEVAELATKASELSQSLKERWLTANYASKRTILGHLLQKIGAIEL